MAIAGTFILAFGWFGFNAGSTLAGTDLRIAVVAVNTMLASAAGALSAMLYVWIRYGKPDPEHAGQRHAGRPRRHHRAVRLRQQRSAPCSSASSPACWSSVAVFFVERTLKIDDPVGAIAVHGVNGAWGVLCARPLRRRHLRRRPERRPRHGARAVLRRRLAARGGGDRRRCRASSSSSPASILFFKLVGATIGNRVPAEVEIEGLDMPEMGVLGYPADVSHEAVAAGMGTVPQAGRRTAGAMRPATE